MVESGVLIAVIIGVAQIVKSLGMDTKFIPLFNVVLGVVLGAFFIGFNPEAILQGLIIGLSASGLYDQSKLFTGGDK